MDFHLKQPIEKQQYHQEEEEESDHQPSPAKLPRLESHHNHNHNDTALPLFSSQQQNLNTFSYPDSKPPLPPSTSRFPTGLGGYFSSSQWQELELQALIFRHMAAGASVPPQLLQLVKKSLLDSSSFHLSNTNFSYYPQPSLYQAAGYWSKANMDPEPGRCRRTDGKKWRCSRDVVAGHKYCERHVHRGRNRSRKPVESSIPATVAAASNHTFRQSGLVGGDGTRFSLSGPTTSLDIFQLNQGVADPKPDGKSPYKAQNDQSGDSTSKLRHFFDDWPKPDNTCGIHGSSTVNSATCLSISTPTENPSVDFLKLSTGTGGDQLSRNVDDGEWSGANQADAMGGPLAEALRSSTGQLPQSASGASCVTA